MAETKVYGNLETIVAGDGTSTYRSGGIVDCNHTQAATTATTDEEVLATYTMPANTMTTDKDCIRVVAFGTLANNANNKFVRVYFGDTAIFGDSSTNANVGWRIECTIVRTGAATQKCSGGGLGQGLFDADYTDTTEDLTGAVTITMRGQNAVASANDIVFEGMIVDFLPAP